MADTVDLENPRWSTFEAFNGAATDIPPLIAELEGAEDEGAFREALDELMSRIYHQYSCTAATYATVPHLVRVMQRLEPAHRAAALIEIGHIAATADPKLDEAPADLVAPFRRALAEAERPAVETFLESHSSLIETYYKAIAAIALAPHPLGKLVMDNLFPHKRASSSAICPRCRESVEVAFFDDGLAVMSFANRIPARPDKADRPASPRLSLARAARTPNVWQPVGLAIRKALDSSAEPAAREHLEAAAAVAENGIRPETQICALFSLIGAMLVIKGFPGPSGRYFHAWDAVKCPFCSAEFTFCEHWWGVAKAVAGPVPRQTQKPH